METNDPILITINGVGIIRALRLGSFMSFDYIDKYGTKQSKRLMTQLAEEIGEYEWEEMDELWHLMIDGCSEEDLTMWRLSAKKVNA